MSFLWRTRKSVIGTYRRNRKSYLHRRARPVLGELGILAHFDGYPAAAIPPQYANLLAIYRLVLQRMPAVILELGGGCSTFAFAHAVKDLRSSGCHAEFHSVDESEYWQSVVRERMPKELLPLVHFWRATPHLVNVHDQEASAFRSLPVKATNFVYVDGGLVPGNKIGADAVLLEANAPNDYAILVDKRDETVAFLRQVLREEYRVSNGPIDAQTLFTLRRASPHAGPLGSEADMIDHLGGPIARVNPHRSVAAFHSAETWNSR